MTPAFPVCAVYWPEASPIVLGVVEEPADAVPLLQGLREHDVEAGVELSVGLVLQRRCRRGPLYEQELWEEVNEGFPDPGSHLVSGRSAEIDIENSCIGMWHRDMDIIPLGYLPIVTTTLKVTRIIVNSKYWNAKINLTLCRWQSHLSEKRNSEGSWRNDFSEQEEEHSQREENGDGEADFLPGVGGKVEHQDREEGDADTWDDQIDGVEKCLPSQLESENDIRVRFLQYKVISIIPELGLEPHLTAGIVFLISLCGNLHDIPLSGNVEVSQVHGHTNAVIARQLVHVTEIQLRF